MLELSTVVQQESSPIGESNAAMSALRVEQARRQLLSTLLEPEKIAAFVAKQLLMDLSKGKDYAEILLIKSNDDSKHLLQHYLFELEEQDADSNSPRVCRLFVQQNTVQEYDFVRLNQAQGLESHKVVCLVRQFMHKLHFLPVYLIALSERIENQMEVIGYSDQIYFKQLRENRLGLKHLRQEMIAQNTGLVAFVAHKYRTTLLAFDDLMQEGMVGLIKATDRFDPERGTCFSTYAIFWIKQAISRLIVKQDKVVPLPVALAEKSSPVFEAMRNTFLRNERWPTTAELKACCNLSEQDLKTISSYYQSTFETDGDNDGEGDGMSVMEKMQQQQFTQPLDQLIDIDLVSYLDRVVSTLPEKQADILAMRFGLKNHTEMTLQAIADHLHVTRERVRQIQNEALNKLKQQFGFDLLLFLEPRDT